MIYIQTKCRTQRYDIFCAISACSGHLASPGWFPFNNYCCSALQTALFVVCEVLSLMLLTGALAVVVVVVVVFGGSGVGSIVVAAAAQLLVNVQCVQVIIQRKRSCSLLKPSSHRMTDYSLVFVTFKRRFLFTIRTRNREKN